MRGAITAWASARRCSAQTGVARGVGGELKVLLDAARPKPNVRGGTPRA
jgi:hypothetical protein